MRFYGVAEQLSRAKHDSKGGGGTRAGMLEGTRLWMVEGRIMQDAYMDVGGRAKHNSREGGGRAKQDA